LAYFLNDFFYHFGNNSGFYELGRNRGFLHAGSAGRTASGPRISKRSFEQLQGEYGGRGYLPQIYGEYPLSGAYDGAQASEAIGTKEAESAVFSENAIKNSVWVTNMLSTGQHLTRLEQGKARAFQKSLLTTYYLGEKTIDINSTLQTDAQTLKQIDNALSVDLFQYLDQSADRADTLDNYLNLLVILLAKCDERAADLQIKIDFLSANFTAQETQTKQSEQVFFDNLKIFQGENAEDELGKFIGVREAQVEVKAKIGAYQSLQNYYKFFRPKLDNLITAIRANRDVLIAGVKVVEIQNMTLPLITKQQ
jgi:hypothetical protein